jgi:peptidoglycan hydrolase-like amidase
MLTPPGGKPVRMNFAGMPEIHLDPASRKAQLVERIGMEDYLASVLATEVNPSWPLEALKAQAVAARSYALDRYLQADDQPWQLHWHYTVDMAYGGMKAAPRAIVSTMAQTRGQTLVHQGLPVPALFHACSGGKTESAKHFRPDLTGADGVTDMTAVMPAVDDPAGITGAEALGFTNTHLNWRAEVPLARITAGLKDWAADHPLDRLAFGTVVAVRMATRFNDSGRVATVTVRHLLGNKELDSEFSAADFRLAVGPGLVRSTNWTRCANVGGGVVVIEGRGYGHGVGMSQVSAYQLARTGSTAADIVKRFYPGAELVQLWR